MFKKVFLVNVFKEIHRYDFYNFKCFKNKYLRTALSDNRAHVEKRTKINA